MNLPPMGARFRLRAGFNVAGFCRNSTRYCRDAKAILVEGNPQVGMQAFMQGKVRVEGDMAKLMMLQGAPPDANAQAVASLTFGIPARGRCSPPLLETTRISESAPPSAKYNHFPSTDSFPLAIHWPLATRVASPPCAGIL